MFPQEPISGYGRNKLACEQVFRRAHDERHFQVTIIRPSSTYGPGAPLIDNLEPDAVAWDRIEREQPVLCAGDGLGLWQSTHRDDCGKLFAYAALNPRTYGQDYNATRDEVLTWRDYYRQGAAALGKTAQLVFMPAAWIVRHDPQRFATSSSNGPGARRRNAWRNSQADVLYQSMIKKALASSVAPVSA